MRRTGPPSLPRIFLAVAKPRWLWMLLGLTLASGAAMLPAMATMADHGASLVDFESASSVARSKEILAGWGSSGERAMWWQLALDLPFLAGYGLFLAGACTAVALRAERGGRPRLARAGAIVAWFGPLAAAADLLQNVSLALVLAGRESQPWPRISDLCGPVTTSLAASAAAFALLGALATRRRTRSGKASDEWRLLERARALGSADWDAAETSATGAMRSQVLELDGMACARHLIPAGFDSARLYAGLPDDMCPCEHWCHLVAGKLTYRFADGETLAVGDGENFHLRAGHLADVAEDAELIELTRGDEYRRKAAHLARSASPPTRRG